MSTTLTPVRERHSTPDVEAAPLARKPKTRSQWPWIAGGFLFAFLVPFLFADLLELNRDFYYGIYAVAVASFLGAWLRFDTVAEIPLGAVAPSRRGRRALGACALTTAADQRPPRCLRKAGASTSLSSGV